MFISESVNEVNSSDFMLGAAIGDIAGSVYEWNNIKYKPEKLIKTGCRFTDDTVLTAAVTVGILRFFEEAGAGWADRADAEDIFTRNVRETIVRYAKKYPDAGYGGSFRRWVRSGQHQPYNSWGNGSAMRVSCCGWAAKTAREARTLAEWSAAVTHNHPEGIRGAQAVAESIWRLRAGASPAEIREMAESYYDMDFTLDQIRPHYQFDVSCQGSVPQAIEAFLEGNSYEDVIRLAISIGGDSDTIAAIAGSMAEIIYPIPEALREEALGKLPDDIKVPLLRAEEMFGVRVG